MTAQEIPSENATNSNGNLISSFELFQLRDFAASRETNPVEAGPLRQRLSREGVKSAKKRVVRNGTLTYKGANTRAVPLVRKEDVHHGRVFFVAVE